MPLQNIFVVEDEQILRVTLTDDLVDAGYTVTCFENPIDALTALQKKPVDVLITDIKMPEMSGLELLRRVKSASPTTEVIMMTAYSSVETAVEAMKNGAYDYISKPFKIDELLIILRRIEDLQTVTRENRRLRSVVAGSYQSDAFIGKSPAAQQCLELVRTVANSQTTVLITGETGTGKELLTNVIHYQSNRSKKPLVKVSCAVLSREIFESELFGHEKGAFTGAVNQKRGRFELAQGGTLYLDDVDDIPLELQVKLLRVLQEQEFERVGSSQPVRADVRVIASTKKDLKELVSRGKFREDLFYRLNVFPIHLAPLRERREDIPLLIEHFCRMLAPEKEVNFQPEVLACLQNYHWPGNVRELKNIVERILLLSKDGQIEMSHIPLEILHSEQPIPENSLGTMPLDKMMAEIEANLIKSALLKCGGNQAKAAKLLRIPASTFRTKMVKYGIRTEE